MPNLQERDCTDWLPARVTIEPTARDTAGVPTGPRSAGAAAALRLSSSGCFASLTFTEMPAASAGHLTEMRSDTFFPFFYLEDDNSSSYCYLKKKKKNDTFFLSVRKRCLKTHSNVFEKKKTTKKKLQKKI